MAKLLKYVNEITCQGDKWHNEYLDVLNKDIADAQYYGQVYKILDTYLENSNQHWIGLVLNKGHLRRLNAIAKSKTVQTYNKRVIALAYDLRTSTHYGALFNREIIKLLDESVIV